MQLKDTKTPILIKITTSKLTFKDITIDNRTLYLSRNIREVTCSETL